MAEVLKNILALYMKAETMMRNILPPALILSLGMESSLAGTPLPLTGVNLAGGEFYKPRAGACPTYGKDYAYPTKAEIDYFAALGMNVFRYQFLWETLQPEVKSPLDQADLARLKAAVSYATSRKLIVLLDPHNYARYYRTNVVGGPTVSFADFADFWRRLAQEFKDDPYVWYGLVNEPHDMPTQQWFDAANAAIAAIRSTGAMDGPSQGDVEAGAVQPIEAPTPPPGMKFKAWAGDTAWLKDPTSAKTALSMPFKDIRLAAVFSKAE